MALPDITKIVAPVWENPDDDGLRAVVGDELLEAGHPWGELVALQLRVADGKATVAEKKLALVLAKRQRKIIGGPIADIANTKNNWVCERGFLVECDLHRRLKNAKAKSLRELDISGGLQIARDAPDKPWCVVKASQSRFYSGYFVSFANGFSPAERKRLTFGSNVSAKVRSELEAAMNEKTRRA